MRGCFPGLITRGLLQSAHVERFAEGKANGSLRHGCNPGGAVAHLHRLIALVLLWVAMSAAYALVPAQYQWGVSVSGPFTHGSPQDACIARGSAGRPLDHVDEPFFDGSMYVARCWWVNSGMAPSQDGAAYRPSGAGACPANSSPVTGGCLCNTGYREDATQTSCVPEENPCQQNKGQPDGIWRYDAGYGPQPNPLASELCKAGTGVRCIVKVADPECTQGRFAGVGNPYWTCRGKAYYTGGWGVGASCDRSTAANGDGSTTPTLPPVEAVPAPDDLPPNTAAPTSCPPGTFEGTVNGTHTCVEDLGRPSTSNSPQTGTTSQTNPNGSTTTTTTTGTTTCTNGSCTTTNNTSTNITNNPGPTCPQGTTPSGPNGSASSCTGTSTGTSTQAQAQFCHENPKHVQCGKGDGGFGGNCAAGFIATGEDPVLNAMALEQYKRNCAFFEKVPDPTEESQAYDTMKAKGKQGGDQTGDLPDGYKREYSIGPGDFDYSSAIGAQQCFSDRSVSLWGHSYAIPLSLVCPWLEILGNLLVVVGSLLAARIVVRG